MPERWMPWSEEVNMQLTNADAILAKNGTELRTEIYTGRDGQNWVLYGPTARPDNGEMENIFVSPDYFEKFGFKCLRHEARPDSGAPRTRAEFLAQIEAEKLQNLAAQQQAHKFQAPEVGSRIAQMREAGQRELQQRADARAGRGTRMAFRNGIRVNDAPGNPNNPSSK